MAFHYPPLIPTAQDTSLAKRSSLLLSKHLKEGGLPKLKIAFEGELDEEVLELPSSLLPFLHRVLEEMAKGNALAVFPEEEVTLPQAAEMLNVSIPFLNRLLEGGELSSRQVGSHRRIVLKELTDYKERLKKQRNEVLDELAAEAQSLKMGY